MELSPAAWHGFGYQVTIKSADGISYSYAHMNAASNFSVDNNVSAGDIVGYVGTTGATTGPCVHVEYFNGSYSDPAPHIASIVSGPVPAPAPAGNSAPDYPFPAGSYFGPKSGPANCISGFFSHRDDFKVWQQQMKNRGWGITVDGLYGDQSANIAHAFQIEKGLVVDSLIGPATWSAAWNAPIT